jgi:hypothetical protein
MRTPKPALDAIYRAKDSTIYMVREVTDLAFVGEYQLVLATEQEIRNGTKVAPITNVEFEDLCNAKGLERIAYGR